MVDPRCERVMRSPVTQAIDGRPRPGSTCPTPKFGENNEHTWVKVDGLMPVETGCVRVGRRPTSTTGPPASPGGGPH
jgi:hypothetical protein